MSNRRVFWHVLTWHEEVLLFFVHNVRLQYQHSVKTVCMLIFVRGMPRDTAAVSRGFQRNPSWDIAGWLDIPLDLTWDPAESHGHSRASFTSTLQDTY